MSFDNNSYGMEVTPVICCYDIFLVQTSLVKIKLLTHRGRVKHLGVGKSTNIGLDNGLSPGRRRAIIWTNAGILLIEPLGINCSEILIEINTISFKKMRLKMSPGKRRQFCIGLDVLSTILWLIGNDL